MPAALRHAASQRRAIWPPEPGFFALRLVRDGWRVAAAIVHAEDRWHAIIDGEARAPAHDPERAPDVERVWHYGIRIPEEDYRWLLAVKDFARVHRPDHPCLNPHKPIDPALLIPLPPLTPP